MLWWKDPGGQGPSALSVEDGLLPVVDNSPRRVTYAAGWTLWRVLTMATTASMDLSAASLTAEGSRTVVPLMVLVAWAPIAAIEIAMDFFCAPVAPGICSANAMAPVTKGAIGAAGVNRRRVGPSSARSCNHFFMSASVLLKE